MKSPLPRLPQLLLVAWLGWAAAPALFAASGKINGIYFESAGKGPCLVLIHGGQMDRRMWDDQMPEFSLHYRVVRYDIRGFGKSDAPARPPEVFNRLVRGFVAKKPGW
jgi:pimeloyl-ACP methyl ester carboxylesterase